MPAQTRPAGRFVQQFNFPEIDNVPNLKDISPRIGAAYDLFGNGKTALKGTFGRYVQGLGGGSANAPGPFIVNPGNTIVQSTTRSWNDLFFPVGDPRRGNFAPDCNLNNYADNDECGPIDNKAFGTPVVNTTYASDVMTGWGNRGYNWQSSLEVQHELRPGMAVLAGYFHTKWENLVQIDNTLVTPADYDQYCITAPADARLPNGGGYPVCGLSDIKPTKFGQVNLVATNADHFGDPLQVYDGIDVAFTARFGHGANVIGRHEHRAYA